MPEILVVSDDQALIEQLQSFVEQRLIISTDEAEIAQLIEKRSRWDFITLFDVMSVSSIFDRLKARFQVLIVGSADQQGVIEQYLEKGAFDYLLTPITPITFHKRLNAIKDLGLITEFAAIWASELKNPLTSIKGYAELLLSPLSQQMSDELRTQSLEIISQKATQMFHLIDLVRDHARISVDRIQLDLMPTQLGEIVPQVIKHFPTRFKTRHTLKNLIPDNLPLVHVNEYYLIRTIETVLNHIQMTTEDTAIVISAVAAHPFVQIAIEDNGAGMTEDEKKRLTDDFLYQWSELAFAEKIILAHGGQLWFESEVGKGTAFYLTLRMYITEAD